MHGNITAFSVFTAAPNFLTTGVSTRLKTRKETEMSEQGYNKARALACLDRAVTALLDMRGSIERLPEVLSAKEGTDMDACDCVRAADDISGRCKEIGLALGFEVITPEYFRELDARVGALHQGRHTTTIDDDIPW